MSKRSCEVSWKAFLREENLPHQWCPGCGYGVILKSMLYAFEKGGLAPKDVVVVTGIGCWGKADDYLYANTVHVTHGRALPVATGIKVANPSMKVIALMGDGDSATIGGNHLIHSSRRNIDVVALVANNLNYGMTGGQYSCTTPLDSRTSTSWYGDPEPALDVCRLSETAGASFVARTTVYHATTIEKYIGMALSHEGFSLVEVISPCPTYFGRYNKLSKAPQMLKWLKEQSIPIERVKDLSEEDLKEKFVTGVFVDKKGHSFLSRYREIQSRARNELESE
jgi:2-oxoglutarate ferredoxin oxidoreductase subunit beta